MAAFQRNPKISRRKNVGQDKVESLPHAPVARLGNPL
jgi:hypothetical protein